MKKCWHFFCTQAQKDRRTAVSISLRNRFLWGSLKRTKTPAATVRKPESCERLLLLLNDKTFSFWRLFCFGADSNLFSFFQFYDPEIQTCVCGPGLQLGAKGHGESWQAILRKLDLNSAEMLKHLFETFHHNVTLHVTFILNKAI